MVGILDDIERDLQAANARRKANLSLKPVPSSSSFGKALDQAGRIVDLAKKASGGNRTIAAAKKFRKSERLQNLVRGLDSVNKPQSIGTKESGIDLSKAPTGTTVTGVRSEIFEPGSLSGIRLRPPEKGKHLFLF